MELLIGSHVREHGHRVGRLAGFELELATRRIRRIVFSPNGELGPQTVTRPLSAISAAGSGPEEGDIDTAHVPDNADAADVTLLSRATRLKRDGREVGRLVGIDVSPADRQLLSVSGRAHWWSKRITFATAELDCSVPGEISVRKPHDSRAA